MSTIDPTAETISKKEWWSSREIAEHYELSTRSVYDAIASGQLTVHRFGQGRGGIRISDADRLAWEAACRKRSTPRSAGMSPPVQPVTTGSPLVAKHFGRRPSARQPSCGRDSASSVDTRG